MKKILLILSFFYLSLNAQEESQSQSIELPDFVITGQQNISIPKVQKKQADFIPLLSEDFFTPDFPGNENTTVELPDVDTEIINLSENLQMTNARLRFNAGLETWPSGDFYYNNWTDNFSYDLNIFGKNELEYVNKAGISLAGASAGAKYFVDHNSKFLPGLEIGLDGNYSYESFNFFGSTEPSLGRTTDNGLFDLFFNYNTDVRNSFGFGVNDSYFNMRDLELNENIFGLRAYYKLKFTDFNFRLAGMYRNQVISSSAPAPSNQTYFNLRASIEFLLYDIINFKAGIYYSEKEGNGFFMPNVFGSIKLTQNFSVYGAFSPSTEFRTLKDFSFANRYYDNNGIFNTQIENKFDLKFALKYEYEQYFEISGGGGYLNSDDNFHFEDDVETGIFNLHIRDIENYYLFSNMLFRKGPFGQFYADMKLQDVTTGNDKKLPYNSNVSAKLDYIYDWENGFGIGIGMTYLSEAYSDIDNINQIPEQVNINLLFYYELFENFDLRLKFENLLDDDYFYFRNYEAKPFDVLAGFEFRW